MATEPRQSLARMPWDAYGVVSVQRASHSSSGRRPGSNGTGAFRPRRSGQRGPSARSRSKPACSPAVSRSIKSSAERAVRALRRPCAPVKTAVAAPRSFSGTAAASPPKRVSSSSNTSSAPGWLWTKKLSRPPPNARAMASIRRSEVRDSSCKRSNAQRVASTISRSFDSARIRSSIGRRECRRSWTAARMALSRIRREGSWKAVWVKRASAQLFSSRASPRTACSRTRSTGSPSPASNRGNKLTSAARRAARIRLFRALVVPFLNSSLSMSLRAAGERRPASSVSRRPSASPFGGDFNRSANCSSAFIPSFRPAALLC